VGRGRSTNVDHVVFSTRKAVGVVVRTDRGAALAAAFASAAKRYWLGVFPHVRREAAHWRRRAHEIPDPTLRCAALANLTTERLNLDGAAAFAAFVPDAHRPAVVRAQVALQVAYDYVDTLAEQPCRDPIRNGDQLHKVLGAALDPGGPRIDYYAHHPQKDDAGYLQGIVETCRTVLRGLPSYAAVAASVRRAAVRMASYQSLHLNESQGDHAALARWACAETPSSTGLRWWETAASAGSSLGVYVLIAAAANRVVRVEDAVEIEEAYFPWIGSLHLLLDSLVDRQEDAAAGQPSLLDYYASPEEAATRLGLLAAESMRRIRALPYGRQHVLLLAGMAAHYLSMPEASRPDALLTARSVLAAIGGLAAPTMLVMGARRAAGRGAHSLRLEIPTVRSALKRECSAVGNSESDFV
jgi:tetraprenyl-beta-curcumene synthase